MRPIYTIILLAVSTLIMTVPLVVLVHLPLFLQLAICVIGMLFGMIGGGMCWSAKMGDDER